MYWGFKNWRPGPVCRVFAVLAALLLMPVSDLRAQSADEGIRAGSFIFKPSLGLAETFDSNFFNEPDDVTSTLITTIEPQISVESDFSRHRLRARARLTEKIVHQSTDDTTNTFAVGTDGVIDVTRRLRISLGSGVQRRAEGRGDDEAENGLDGPVYSDRYRSRLSVQYEAGDFRIEPFANVALRDFINRGQLVNQDDRDRLVVQGGLEVGYRVARGYEAFVRGTYFNVDFRNAVDDNGVNRDSQGVETLVGVRLKLSRLITGTAGAGFVISQFDDPQFSNTTDFLVQLGLDWTPTRRLGFSLNARRELEQTNVAGAADKIQTDASASARYEILRNLNGSVRIGLDRTEFNGIDRTDTGLFGGIGIDWQVMRRVSLNLSYIYAQEFSTDANEEFTKHQVTLGTRYGF